MFNINYNVYFNLNVKPLIKTLVRPDRIAKY